MRPQLEFEYCQSIQALVTQGSSGLALTLADAGLSFYPQSEEILKLAAMLAINEENWPLAAELLQDLLQIHEHTGHSITQRLN